MVCFFFFFFFFFDSQQRRIGAKTFSLYRFIFERSATAYSHQLDAKCVNI